MNKLYLLACLSAAYPSLSLASELGIERITVSSDFRLTELQSIGASVSVINENVINQRQSNHLEDILNTAANINFTSGASRGRFIQIRGIGERSQFAEPINPSVGLLIDDFDFSGIASVGTLFDVEQVEVLRGPQATEFGAAGMAGTIKIKTAEADAQQSTKLLLSLAQQNTINVGAAFGSQLSEKAFFRVAANQYKSDGFVENIFLDREDTDNLDEFTGRVKFKYLFSDTVKLDVNYQYFDIDNGYDAFSLDNDRKSRADEPGFDRQETHALGFKLSTELDSMIIDGIVNYSTSQIDYGFDEDWTFVGFHPFEYQSSDYYYRERDNTNLDLRLISKPNGKIFNDTTNWLIGAFRKRFDESLLRQYTFADGDFSSRYQPTTNGLYGQLDTQLSNDLSLSLGLRAEDFSLNYADSNQFSEVSSDTLIGGKSVLTYTNGRASVYGSVSRGYKAGGFNPNERVSQEQRIFAPEYNWNYELGVKGSTLDNDLLVRMAIFYMDRKDTQISDYDVLTREDGSAEFIDIIDNADNGTNWGVELEADWQASDSLNLFASYGFLDATFSGYSLADGTEVDQQTQAQAPKHTLHLAAVGYLKERLSVRLDMDLKDDFRFSDGHDERSPFTVLVNAQMNAEFSRWTLSFWAKNLFDREYYVRGFGGFSNDPRDEYAFAEPYFQLGDGRQFGITANYVY